MPNYRKKNKKKSYKKKKAAMCDSDGCEKVGMELVPYTPREDRGKAKTTTR